MGGGRRRRRSPSCGSPPAQDPDDAQLVELVGELSLHSDAFRRIWARHDVKSKCFGVKRYQHPQVGLLELDYETLALPDTDQLIVTYTAAPGSETETGAEAARRRYAVSRIGAPSVMTMVCSKCAAGEPSSVRIVQPSSST